MQTTSAMPKPYYLILGKNKLAAEITPLDIEKFKTYPKDKAKPSTVNRNIAFLKHNHTKGIEWGKVFENPAKKVKLFKEDNRRLRFYHKGRAKSLWLEQP